MGTSRQRRVSPPAPAAARGRACGRALGAWLGCLALALAIAARAQEAAPSEYQVKAAFLYNFAKFVEWPSGAFTNAHTSIVIGVFGENPFGQDLVNGVEGKTIEGRSIVVRPVRSLGELKQCHIVFICSAERRRLPEVLRSLREASVLTVSEADRAVDDGVMITLFMEGKRVRFEIDDQAAARAGLKISPRLLKLARKKSRGE